MPAISLVSLLLTQPTASVPTGGVTVAARGGNPDLTQLFLDIPGLTTGTESMLQQAAGYYSVFSGAAPGAYEGTITDQATPTTRLNFSFVLLPPPVLGCTDPAADNYDPYATQDNGSCAYTPPPRVPHLVFSPAQSLRFTQPGNPELPDYDNAPLADQAPLNTNNPGFCQLYERGDTVVVQLQSNYGGVPDLSVVPCDGGPAVLTVVPTRVVQGAGVSAAFDAYARREVATGKTRLYFNDNTLPFPFAAGSRVTLANAPGLNGTYPVADVREDPAAGVPYLLLSVPYPDSSQRIDVDLTTPYALQGFDTWQAVVPFNAVPVGCHTVRVSVTDPDFGPAVAVSEPLDIAVTHRDTVLVQYRNFDNAFGLNYTAGISSRLRARGSFFGQDNPAQKTTLRESTGKLTLLEASIQRRITLKVYQLPDWLHEKLAVAFCHDYVRVNGLKGIAGEDYSYPPTPAYALTNGTVQVEQEDFLGAGNRDDVGDVDGGPFLLANDKFLRINF